MFCRVETHGLADMRKHRSQPQDLNQDGLVRITRPASHSSATMKDEGIVQPVSKEMEQLSRRLHHFSPPAPQRPEGGTLQRRLPSSEPSTPRISARPACEPTERAALLAIASMSPVD